MHVQHHPGRSQIAILGRVEPEHRVVALADVVEAIARIQEHHLKQAQAAQILMVSRPRVSDVVNLKTSKFTIDTLVAMLTRAGKPVRLAVG